MIVRSPEGIKDDVMRIEQRQHDVGGELGHETNNSQEAAVFVL